VKIRGFRVELAEIESVLLEFPQVKAVAVTLREDVPGSQLLVGYIVLRGVAYLEAEKLRAGLRERLPVYMVPAILETVLELPTLPSGKVDRKRLPPPSSRPAESERELILPRSPLERQIAAVWRKLFSPLPISVRDDFFLDLGGHSLLAARMVSELRTNANLETISMLDIYRYPTISLLAEAIEGPLLDGAPRLSGPGSGSPSERPDASASGSTELQSEPHAPVPFWRHFLCGAAQLFSLVFVLSFFALQWLAPYLTYTILVEEEYDLLEAILGAFASLVLVYPVMLCIPILVKWVVIGRYKPGAYPLCGMYYFRWWFVTTIESAVPVGYMTGTPLLNIYLRLMGAKVGSNVHLGSESFAIYDLVSIGDDSSINVDANLLGYTVENGWLKIGSIKIGKKCFVGARAAVLARSRQAQAHQHGGELLVGRAWRAAASSVSTYVSRRNPRMLSRRRSDRLTISTGESGRAIDACQSFWRQSRQ